MNKLKEEIIELIEDYGDAQYDYACYDQDMAGDYVNTIMYMIKNILNELYSHKLKEELTEIIEDYGNNQYSYGCNGLAAASDNYAEDFISIIRNKLYKENNNE